MTDEQIFRVGHGRDFIQLRRVDGPSHGGDLAQANFCIGGLSGEWFLELVNVDAFIQDLKSVHSSLSGTAVLSDDDGLQIIFTVEKSGRAMAHVWINNQWNFGIDGLIEFDIELDQTFLPQLWTDLATAFRREAPRDQPSPALKYAQ